MTCPSFGNSRWSSGPYLCIVCWEEFQLSIWAGCSSDTCAYTLLVCLITKDILLGSPPNFSKRTIPLLPGWRNERGTWYLFNKVRIQLINSLQFLQLLYCWAISEHTAKVLSVTVAILLGNIRTHSWFVMQFNGVGWDGMGSFGFQSVLRKQIFGHAIWLNVGGKKCTRMLFNEMSHLNKYLT